MALLRKFLGTWPPTLLFARHPGPSFWMYNTSGLLIILFHPDPLAQTTARPNWHAPPYLPDHLFPKREAPPCPPRKSSAVRRDWTASFLVRSNRCLTVTVPRGRVRTSERVQCENLALSSHIRTVSLLTSFVLTILRVSDGLSFSPRTVCERPCLTKNFLWRTVYDRRRLYIFHYTLCRSISQIPISRSLYTPTYFSFIILLFLHSVSV